MRTAALRLCLSGFLVSALPSLTLASIEYSAKTDEAGLFRSETLEPPPLTTVNKGETLKLLHKGASRSEVETAGGLKGWMKNEDIEQVALSPGQRLSLGNQLINGDGEFNHSIYLIDRGRADLELLPIDRNFNGEIPENIDKEQLEMKNGDN